ncbi:MAG: glycerophosphoryl diester phosphodiesterase membrane domain-containing protein [Candidatus Limnocylindrales bacterium]
MDQMPGSFPPPPDANQPQWGNRPQPSMYPLDLGRLLSLTFSIFRFRWKMFVGLALLIMTPIWILLAAVDLAVGDTTNLYEEISQIARAGGSIDAILPRLWQSLAVDLAVGAVAGIATFVATGALTHAAADVYSGARASATTSIRHSLSRFPAYLGLWLVIFLITVAVISVGVLVGTALFLASATGGSVVPGPAVFLGLIAFVAAFAAIVFLAIRWIMAVPAIVLDNVGVTGSLRRSWRLVSGSSWRVLGYLLLFALLLGLIGGLLGAVLTLIINPFTIVGATVVSVDPTRLAISTFVAGLISSALMPISAIGMTLLYFDLRSRKGEKVPLPGHASAAVATPDSVAE